AAATGSSQSPGPDTALVEAICARLDGMPLAIELAAARARTMSLAELATALEDRLRLLRGSAPDRPSRHQTLTAAFDWSYDLLDSRERLMFDRLAIFPGTFDRAAAAAVGRAGSQEEEYGSDDILESLVDKSMTTANRSGVATRFLTLETLRQYGRSHLN